MTSNQYPEERSTPDDLPPNRSHSRRASDQLPAAFLAGIVARFLPFILASAVGAALIAVLVTALQPRRYTSIGSFVPQSRRGTSGFSGLAAQFGIGSVGGDAGQSPTFYADLLRTREMLRRVATATYSLKDEAKAKQGPLAGALGNDRPYAPEATDKAIAYLRKATAVSFSAQTGIVTVEVTTGEPTLASQVNAEMLKAVDSFNRENQHAQAAYQRTFAEERLNEFRAELRAAESALQEFLHGNRDFATSSEAAFQRERLAREVALRQQLYISVTQAFEQARMEEARDSPQITIIERPEPALRPNPKGYLQRGALGFLLGTLSSMLFVLVREIVRHGRSNMAAWYSDWAVGRRKGHA